MIKNFIPKEISWLSFNERVLQEAEDDSVPVCERLKFMGIFSKNLDEYFRVRVATLRRLSEMKIKTESLYLSDPQSVLEEIFKIVVRLGKKFDSIYEKILNDLSSKHVYIINDKQLSAEQAVWVENYFIRSVQHKLMPVMIRKNPLINLIKDESLYFAVIIRHTGAKQDYAIMELPWDILDRFVLLPKTDQNQYIILLDDIVRSGLPKIFSFFEIKSMEAYTFKMTRDAELDIHDDVSESFLKIITKSLQKRKEGNPVRFVFDSSMPPLLLKVLKDKFKFKKEDSILPGGRYHNFKDFINFPRIDNPDMYYKPFESINYPVTKPGRSIFSEIDHKDLLLYYPYHSFDFFIQLLREASIDPKVSSIFITLYRLAEDSSVIKALLNALRNGKNVTAVIELQARFDEEANIFWSNRLKDEGAKIIYGVPNLKVHCKLCLVSRVQNGRNKLYACFGTGNFNEDTTRTFTDFNLFTANPKITREMFNIFTFFRNNYNVAKLKHLIISPFQMRTKFEALIKKEIAFASKGKNAFIHFKLNNLEDPKIINLLYKASKAGVKIILNVRGILSLIPCEPGISENIEAFSIVDHYLEHARVYVFGNGGNYLVFLSSADLMSRNIDRRIEVTAPVYDPNLREQIMHILNLQYNDNVKSRIFNRKQDNRKKPVKGKPALRSQSAIWDYLFDYAYENRDDHAR